jgi:hypothetical protein
MHIPHFIFYFINSFYSIHNLDFLLLRSWRAMAMQLRSGRRLDSPAPKGDLRRVRPRLGQDGSDDDGKDRISSLPKDMRLKELAASNVRTKLCALASSPSHGAASGRSFVS